MNLNNKKVVRAWYMYDWANSVYSLVITSTIFPVYYNNVTRQANGSDILSFFGFQLPNTVLYSYALSFSFLLIATILPLLSGIADYSGKKKQFMMFFTYLGSLACAGLFFFDGHNIEYGIICAVLACIGYSGSLVFYDSFLPEVVTFDRYDMASARGYAYGYIGSVILLVVNLAMVEFPEVFYLSNGSMAAKVSFLAVGLWWAGFAQITFHYLPDNVYNRKDQGNYLSKGYQEISMVWQNLKQSPILKKYLLAFFFYNTGVQTVMYLAATFGEKELRLPGDKLIMTILIINIVAIFGAYLFAKISKKRGNKLSLQIMIFIWILICIGAYFVENANQFYTLAFVVGIVMGGIQSLSRATYTKLLPPDTIDHASYFSFYDVVFNVSIVVGTFSYGLIEHITGSMRNSTLALGLFFIIGIGYMSLVRLPLERIIKPIEEEEKVS